MAYEPLNNIATGDAYSDANTLWAPGAVRFNFDVANAAIYYQLGVGARPSPQWLPEVFLTPSFRSIARRADAVRVRSGAAGTPARVTLEAVPGAETTVIGAP
jgi:hypothetical protein